MAQTEGAPSIQSPGHAAVRAPDLAGKKAPLTAEPVFAQIVQRANLDRLESGSKLSIQLRPDFLGRIEIETRIGTDEVLQAVIRVEDVAVKKLVQAELGSLVEKLNELGIKVESAEVTGFPGNGPESDSRRSGAEAQQSHEGNRKIRQEEPSGLTQDGEDSSDQEDGAVSYFA